MLKTLTEFLLRSQKAKRKKSKLTQKSVGRASTALWGAQSMKHCSEMKKTILHIKKPGGYIESRRDNSRGETYKPLIPPNITRFKRVSVLGNILSLLA